MRWREGEEDVDTQRTTPALTKFEFRMTGNRAEERITQKKGEIAYQRTYVARH